MWTVRQNVYLRTTRFKPVSSPQQPLNTGPVGIPQPASLLPPPTPQTPPTLFGVLQAMGTAWVAYKVGETAGVPPEYAAMIAGTVVSAVTSGLHKWAENLHRKEVAK